MKIIVIGSKGFIGAQTLLYFNRKGHETFGCDVVVEYNDANYFQVDATNSSYDEIFLSQHFDVCINCSGAASVPDSFKHPLRDFHQNVHNVYLILEAIRKHIPKCKFINLSSAAVYGNPEVLPISETSSIKPLSPYGWHKSYSENICSEFYNYFGIKTCSLRIFSAYGPGLAKQLFWDWAQKIKKSPEIMLFGTGKESRDFIFIEDLIFAIECVIEGASFTSDIINVGNGKEILIEEAIEVFKKQSGLAFTFKFNNERRSGDPINWRADVSKLLSLGYNQQVSFETGIKKYFQWLNEKK